MRIVCLSDTHTYHIDMKHEVPSGDLLLFAGDLMSCGYWENEIEDFCNWFSSFPHKNKVFIAGNHDRLFQNAEPTVKEIIAAHPGITYLKDESCIVDGVKIYGSPWQPWFHSWAFNFPNPRENPARAKAHAENCWEQIPLDADIVISHGPPAGILDKVKYDKIHVGCPQLLARLYQVKPVLHLFGHIHETYGVYSADGITFANASICDLDYRAVNKPLVFDYYPEIRELVEVV